METKSSASFGSIEGAAGEKAFIDDESLQNIRLINSFEFRFFKAGYHKYQLSLLKNIKLGTKTAISSG